MLLHLLWLLCTSLSSLLAPSAPAVTGKDVLQKMHDRYAGKFSPYFTFDQTAVRYQSPTDSTMEVWHEAISFPGRLIIKFGDQAAGNGAIYAQDSVFSFKNNQLQSRRRRVHELLVLAFDVYHQPVERTAAQLQEAGIALSKAFETTWRGK
ncbi:MAG: outer membrane lipoprotein-sorting protein, partial [Rufibacter sp.]